jgi:Tfp pilus assembly protein PilO
MAPLKLSDRERNLLTATIAVVALYVFYLFLLSPKWNELDTTRQAARSAKQDLKLAESRVKLLDALERSIGLAPQQRLLSRDEKTLEVLQLLSQATVRSGLTLNQIQPALEEQTEGLKFYLSCTGRFKAMYAFFKILNRLRTLVIIDSLDVASSGWYEPELEIKINLTAYY